MKILSAYIGKAHWTPIALSSVALCLFPGCERTPAPPPPKAATPVGVQLASVKRGEATRSIALPATVQPYQQATLYAKVTGYVKTVNVDKGDAVKSGQLLADIEVPELLADRARFKAEAEIAALDYQRAKSAQAKAPDLVLQQTVDTAKSAADVAQANLERTDTLLGFTKIPAPFDGIITKRFVDPGAFIPAATSGSTAQNAALFGLMDFDRVRVQVPVPEPDVPWIKSGLPVKMTVEELGTTTFAGTITRFAYALDDSTKTMLAEIELPNPKHELRPGMYATVHIVIETRPGALLIPAAALVSEKTRNSVFTLSGDKARRVTVKTGFNDAGWIEILEGLSLGEPVILAGNQALADGQPAKVTEAK